MKGKGKRSAVLLAATVLAVLVLASPIVAGEADVVRSLSTTSPSPGDEFTVTLSISDIQIGGIVETIPDGFTFPEHPLDYQYYEISGQKIAFAVIDETAEIKYKVEAPSSGEGTFSGFWEDFLNEINGTIANTSISVEDDDGDGGGDDFGSTPTPTATLSLNVTGVSLEVGGKASAASLGGIPGDTDEDDKLAEDELADAILSYMLEEEGHLELSDLWDAAHVYVYWNGEPRTITDSADRVVTIYKPIKRVVCTLSHHIEALRILKVSKDKIVGVPSGYLDPYFFAEFDDVQGIGYLAWEADIEAILALHPDVVLLPAAPGPFETTADDETELLESAGLTVVRLTFNQPEIFTEELENSGYIFEKEEESGEFINWHDDILNSIVEKTSELPPESKTKVYSEYYSYPPYSVTTADDDIIATAGGKDIFEGLNAELSAEDVIFEDPEIMLGAVYREEGYGLDADDTAALEEVRDDIMGRAVLKNATAVKNERVYIITSHVWTYLPYSGCRSTIGLCYLAKWFHPDLFPDLDPKAVHQEYLTRFQGLDIDLDENGVFVYPEPEIDSDDEDDGDDGDGSDDGDLGGTPTPIPISNATGISIEAGKEESLTFDGLDLAVSKISIRVDRSVSGVEIVVQEAGKPENIPKVSGIPYRYFNITAANLTANVTAKIEFKVNKSWITDNNVNETTIMLNRYDGNWTVLPTSKLSEDEVSFYFEAETPGFSLFAISGEKKMGASPTLTPEFEETPTAIATPKPEEGAPAPTPAPTSPPLPAKTFAKGRDTGLTAIIAVIVASIAVLALVTFAVFRKRSKGGEK